MNASITKNINDEQISKIMEDWSMWPISCLPPSSEQFDPVVKGLTNSNWLFHPIDKHTGQKSDDSYVIRLNAQNAHSLNLNRHAEWHIHQSAAQFNICTPFIYRDPRDIYWLRPYIPSNTLFELLNTGSHFNIDGILEHAAKKFKLIHNMPTSSAWPRIVFSDRTEHYWKQILNPNLPDQARQELTELKHELDSTLESIGFAPRLCHMDANPNNWIIDNNQLYLIDWEYSAIANPLWDLAVFCDEFELDPLQTETFLNCYGRINNIQFELASKQMRYLSALWYGVQGMYDSKKLIEELQTILEFQHTKLQKQLEF